MQPVAEGVAGTATAYTFTVAPFLSRHADKGGQIVAVDCEIIREGILPRPSEIVAGALTDIVVGVGSEYGTVIVRLGIAARCPAAVAEAQVGAENEVFDWLDLQIEVAAGRVALIVVLPYAATCCETQGIGLCGREGRTGNPVALAVPA